MQPTAETRHYYLFQEMATVPESRGVPGPPVPVGKGPARSLRPEAALLGKRLQSLLQPGDLLHDGLPEGTYSKKFVFRVPNSYCRR